MGRKTEVHYAFEEWISNDVTADDFRKSYQRLEQADRNIAPQVFLKMRRWLGKMGLISDHLSQSPKGKLKSHEIDAIFEAINKIGPCHIGYFQEALMHSHTRVFARREGRIPLPNSDDDTYALVYHGVVHPEVAPIMNEIYSLTSNDDAAPHNPERHPLWHKVSQMIDRHRLKFDNTFANEHPELWGICPR